MIRSMEEEASEYVSGLFLRERVGLKYQPQKANLVVHPVLEVKGDDDRGFSQLFPVVHNWPPPSVPTPV